MLPAETALTGAARVMVRAEDIVFGQVGAPAQVVSAEYYGHDQLVTVRLGSGQIIKVRQKTGQPIAPGEHRNVQVTGDVLVFPWGVVTDG